MTIAAKVRNHVKQRAQERLDFAMTTRDTKRLAAMIRNNQGRRFTNYPPRYRDWYKINFDGRWIIAIFCPIHQEVKTVLPDSASPEYRY
jgi:hypothetical protein